jgi:hypothetical protein
MKVEFIDFGFGLGCHEQEMRAPVRLVLAPHHEPHLLEVRDEAAEVARIQPEITRKIGGGVRAIVRKLVKNAHLGERKMALVKPFMESARVARVKPVEAPDGFNTPTRIKTAHLPSLSQKSGFD